MKRVGLILAAWILSAGIAQAGVYKYTDADGTVSFTDEPPNDFESELVELPSIDPPSTPTPVGVSRRNSEPIDSIGDIDARPVEDPAREQLRAAESQCTAARVALEVLNQVMPVYKVRNGEYRAAWNGDTHVGHREYLNEAQRQSAINAQYRAMVSNCAEPFSAVQQEQAYRDWYNAEPCESAREDLRMILQPGSRTPDDAVEQKQKIVDQYCGD